MFFLFSILACSTAVLIDCVVCAIECKRTRGKKDWEEENDGTKPSKVCVYNERKIWNRSRVEYSVFYSPFFRAPSTTTYSRFFFLLFSSVLFSSVCVCFFFISMPFGSIMILNALRLIDDHGWFYLVAVFWCGPNRPIVACVRIFAWRQNHK